MNISKWLLCLYPRAWRNRYEEEFLELLEARPLTFFDQADLLWGAIDAYLHPHLSTSEMAPQEKARYLSCTLRGSLLAGFGSYMIFGLAGFSFQKMTEDRAFMDAASASSLVGASFQFMVISGIISLLALLAGGLPIICATIRDAWIGKHYGRLGLLAVPFCALALFWGIVEALINIPALRLPTLADGIIFFGGLLLITILSTAAVCLAVKRSAVPGKVLRFAVLPACILTVAMVFALLAMLLWGLGIQSNAPALLTGNDGLLRSSTLGTWLRIVAAMVIATGLAVGSLWRAIKIRSRLQEISL